MLNAHDAWMVLLGFGLANALDLLWVWSRRAMKTKKEG